MNTSFDWQGHRGARGLLPENTVGAFLHALTYPQIKTLEMDLAVTADGQLIVSHEPWMSALICTHPDGRAVLDPEEKDLAIYRMTLAEVQGFDCGQRGNTNFSEQSARTAHKPTLPTVVAATEQVARDLRRPLPYYNIEIKSRPEWDTAYTPPPAMFTKLVLSEIHRLGIAERTTIQSFDIRSLQAVREQDSAQSIAYLIANQNSVAENLSLLGFKPDIYSPYYELCNREMPNILHSKSIQVIPWTVNDPLIMQQLIEMGVDGIITDYPDRIVSP